MLKNKNKLFIIVLLNAALIIAPVQIALASSEKNSHEHGLANPKVNPCKHSKSATNSFAEQYKLSKPAHQHIHQMTMADEGNASATDNPQHQECKCAISCADCYAGHATVVLLDFEFYQFAKPSSSQPAGKNYHYEQISLPVENPPPLA